MCVIEAMIDANRGLPVVIGRCLRTRQRSDGNDKRLTVALESHGLIERRRRGGQEVEQCPYLRQIAGGLFDDGFAGRGRRAVQRLSDSELAVPPTLN